MGQHHIREKQGRNRILKSQKDTKVQVLQKGAQPRTHRTHVDEQQGNACTELTHISACPRCQGLMVREYFMNSIDVSDLWGSGWRCINCGVIVDPVIISNQKHPNPNERAPRCPRLRR